MWFETRLDPNSRHYNLLWEVSISGPLDEAKFRFALDRLVERHPSMRTHFCEENGEPRATVTPGGSVPCEYQDLCGRGAGEIEAWRRREGDTLAGGSLDLTAGPLFGFRVARVSGGEHRVLMVAHHMVTDGFSWPVLLQDLVTGLAGGAVEPVSATPADVARWQRDFLVSEAGAKAERYWRQCFPEAPAMTELPGQRERPAVLDRAGSTRTRVIPSALMDRVRACAREQGSSVFRTLLAAFSAVLHRWTGDPELVIGTTFLGRSMAGAERVVGFLNNVAAVRVVVEPGVTFSNLVRTVHRTVTEAVNHQEYPFSRLASGWKGARAPNRIGLTRVSFTKLPKRVVGCRGDFEVRERRLFLDRSPHELAFYVQEDGTAAEVVCEFNPVLYGEEVVGRWLAVYLQFLEAATVHPDALVMSHSLILPEDATVLPDPLGVLDRPRYSTVSEELAKRWSERPARTAIEQRGHEWTYGELKEVSGRIARSLIRRGLRAGDVVAISGPRSFGLIAGIIAIWRAGCVLLTLDPLLPLDRRRVMTKEARFAGWIVVAEHGKGDVEELTEGFPRVSIIEVAANGVTPWGDEGERESGAVPDREPCGDAAYLFFTSGTTGVPKAVLGNHQGLGHFLAWQRTTFEIGPEDRAAQLTGLSFDVVLRDIFTPLTAGAILCLPGAGEEHLAGRLMEWLEEERITLLHTVPSLAQAWLQQAPEAKPLTRLRLTFFAGEPLTPAMVLRWRAACPATRVLNLYGPTETTLAKCCHEVGHVPDPGIQPVGHPQPQTQAWVLNEAGVLCGVGEPGEIVLRTPFCSLGYANAPEETARKFVPNPFRPGPDDRVYFTGDRGRFRSDGVLEILGRTDSQVKIRGVRIELNEVTSALASHPDVQSSVVVAREDESGRKALVGYVVPRGRDGGLPSKLTEHLHRLLPAAFVPEAIVVLERLPLTPNGKLDRKALPVPIRSTRSALASEPRNLTERQVVDLMRELLRDGDLGPEDNFFESGGHSLLALQWMAGVRRLLGVEVPLRVLFEKPTAAAVARAVNEERARKPASGWKSLTTLNLGEVERPALFVFTGGNGGDRELYVHSYLAQKWLGGRRPVYGLRMRGWDGAIAPHDDIHEMARDYIAEIRSVQPRGPYFLLGDCTGGNIAFETAVQLQAAGEAVPLLLLADCIRPRAFEYLRFVVREAWRRRSGKPWAARWRALQWRPGLPVPEDLPRQGPEGQGDGRSVDAPDQEYWTAAGRRYRRVITSYRPGLFRGRLSLVVSHGRSRDKRILRWGEHATEGAAITELPDNHWLYLWHHGDRVRQLLEQAERSTG